MEKGSRPLERMAKMLDCNLKVSEFELQSRYYIYFWTNNLGKEESWIILSTVGLIVSLLVFYTDSFDIE